MKRVRLIFQTAGGAVLFAVSFWLTLGYLDLGSSTLEAGYDRPTANYKPGNGVDPVACGINCTKDASCAAWVYAAANKACLFLPTVPKAIKNDCCTSGVVRRSIFF